MMLDHHRPWLTRFPCAWPLKPCWLSQTVHGETHGFFWCIFLGKPRKDGALPHQGFETIIC